MSLPPEVLALLGDDATPEKAIEKLDASADRNVERVRSGRPPVDGWATKAHWMAIAAAAIRECEASREANAAVSEIPGDLEKVDLTQAALGAAMQDYDALRNRRNP